MSAQPYLERQKLATSLVKRAGRMVIAASGAIRATRKHDESVVTGTDHAVQACIVEAIKEHFPDDAMIGEERSHDAAASRTAPSERFCWVIDPIDGTRNYVASFPCFATSIAVLERALPVVAVVREHSTGHLVAATAHSRTTLNGNPVSLNRSEALTDVIVGVPSSKEPLTVAVVQRLAATRGIVLRDMGATTFHLALVASGALAAAFCQRAKLWDVAAGALLVQQAGGIITGAFGEPLLPLPLEGEHDRNVPFLAGTPPSHARLLELIAPLRELS